MISLVGLALLLSASLQPIGSQQRHSKPVTRRSFFTAAAATTAVGLFSPPAYALGEPVLPQEWCEGLRARLAVQF